jgi:D-inositol-3-phosphate glycosyltransferase
MACGVPVVASRVGGPKSLINQGGNGYLIPWVCPEPFSEKLEILLSNEILRKNMANASISTARNLDWNNTANKLSNIYSSLAPVKNIDVIGA